MLLKDKVVMITGGAGLNGLGYATARNMVEQGARVVILDLERAESDRLFPGITGILNQDMADIEALGVGQTPTFFLNGTRLENFSAESLVAAVRSAVENA